MTVRKLGMAPILACSVVVASVALQSSAGDGADHSPKRHVLVNLSLDGWTDAFDALHDQLSTYYAFSDWKDIDWGAMYSEYWPRIAAAESIDDSAAYFLALREYVYTVPDAHVGLFALEPESEAIEGNVRYEQIGGDIGFALIETFDGRFVARWVSEGSPAAQAGMEIGAEVTQFDNTPIDVALQQVSVLWAIAPPATVEGKLLQQGRFIGRAPIGTTVSVVFQNPGTSSPTTAQLTAVDDGYESLLATFPCDDLPPDVFHDFIETDEGPLGYLRLTTTGDDDHADQIIDGFRDAIQALVDASVVGVIVDLRTNTGGLDRVAATVPGHFYLSDAHYEHASFYDPQTGDFEVDPRATLTTEPLSPQFGGSVVAMTGPCTVSSGEGVAMAIQKLPQGETVGFYGTYGSFGLTGGEVFMPGGYLVVFATGRSLDEDFVIQIDSDAELKGGVVPDLRVSLTDETIRRNFVEGIDVVLEASIDRVLDRPPAPRRSGGVRRPASP